MTHDSPPSPGTGSGPGADRPAVTTSYRYAPIPEALLYDHDIDPLAVRVYGCLARHGESASNCYPSHGRIADLIGVSKRSIARPLKALEDAGWIVRYPRFDERRQRLADGYDLRETRAPERAPHAEERGTPTLDNGDPPTLRSVDIKGEQEEREQENERTTSAPPTHTNVLALSAPEVAPAAPDDGFEGFWLAYPARKGIRRGKGTAHDLWRRMSPQKRQAALGAVGNFASFCERSGEFPPDCHRWLKGDLWDDFRQPVDVPAVPARNGSRSSYLQREGVLPLAEAVAQAMNGTAAHALPRGEG